MEKGQIHRHRSCLTQKWGTWNRFHHDVRAGGVHRNYETKPPIFPYTFLVALEWWSVAGCWGFAFVFLGEEDFPHLSEIHGWQPHSKRHVNKHKKKHKKSISSRFVYLLLCMGVLPACMSVQCVCLEDRTEGIKASRTRATEGHELACVYWESNPGPPEVSALNSWVSN